MNQQKPKFLVWDSFQKTANGNGGSHRSQQLRELYERAGATAVTKDQLPLSLKQLAITLLNLPAILARLPFGSLTIKNMARAINLDARVMSHPINLIVCEKCYWSPWIIALNYRLPIICIPHNIESLVPGQKNALNEDELDDFRAEIKLLREMIACFCICPEDAAILKPFGVKTFVLPYYPSDALAEELKRIRAYRESATNNLKTVLILGTAVNGPTYLGMLEIMKTLHLVRPDIRRNITVVGHGTEALKSEYGHLCNIKGTVSKDELEELYRTSKCLFVNHVPTSGCITRITEALLAGIPVVGNEYAARGYAGTKGLMLFNDIAHGLELTHTLEPHIPPEPKRPLECEENFISSVRELLCNQTLPSKR